jgi:hypothetical protein
VSGDASVQFEGLVSDNDLQAWLAKEIHRYLHIRPRKTREQLAEDSGVNIWTIDALRSTDLSKRRPLHPGQLLSLCYAMGDRAVNGLLAHIGYGGASLLGEGETLQVGSVVAEGMRHLTVIATAAADGKIDHTEQPQCQQAADDLIAAVIPISSAGKAA